MIRRFIDIGIAVRDIDSAVEEYSQVLGVRPRMLGPEHYVYPGLKGARFYLANATISLVTSKDADSPISKFIAAVFLHNAGAIDLHQANPDTIILTRPTAEVTPAERTARAAT